MHDCDRVNHPPVGTHVLAKLEVNRRSPEGVVGKCLTRPWIGSVVFFKDDGIGMRVGEYYTVEIRRSHLRPAGGYLLGRPVAAVPADKLSAILREQNDDAIDAQQDDLRVAEKPGFCVTVGAKADIKISGKVRTLRQGYWYFFPFGRMHDKFAVAGWPVGHALPSVGDDITGYQALFSAMHAARGAGLNVWWPEMWSAAAEGPTVL